MTAGATDGAGSPRIENRTRIRRGVLVAVVLGLGGAVAVAATADPDTRNASGVSVPGMNVVVEGIPRLWTMRPAGWALTRSESGGVVAATSSWWPSSAEDDQHNAFEICVERAGQSTCPVAGPLVARVSELPGGRRASISVMPRTPSISDDDEMQTWRKVEFK